MPKMKSDAFSEARFLKDFYQTTFTGRMSGQGGGATGGVGGVSQRDPQ